MKVLFLTDSLSLPRSYKNAVVKWEEIYFTRLKQRFPDVEFILMAMGGATIVQIQLALNYYVHTNPDLVILQSGIVDCAPRAFGQLEQQIIFKLKLFRLVKPFVKTLRKYRRISYTSPKTFEATLLKIKHAFPGKPFIAIGILPGCKDYDLLLPNVSKKIVEYNGILAGHTDFIENDDFPAEGIVGDFHHMNAYGHNIIYHKLEPVIERHIGIFKTKQPQ